jgi:hypothetical protein
MAIAMAAQDIASQKPGPSDVAPIDANANPESHTAAADIK